MDSIDVLVVGAGVIGLSVAKALSEAGLHVVVVEGEQGIGTGISSRSSEVIHAGIYYPPGSLKAILCVAGKKLLYDYCQSRGIPHAQTGKLIVAVDSEQARRLSDIHARAAQNGVSISWLTPADVRALEPVVNCHSGLWSPSSGVVDSHQFMLALQGDVEAASGSVVLRTRFVRAERRAGGFACELESQGDPFYVHARLVVNCAGLYAWDVASALGEASEMIPPRFFAKGHYFVLTGRSPFKHLVYPVPVPGGLGTHVTIDLGGGCRFGPDVAWISDIDYTFLPDRKNTFVESIRRYWPDVPTERLLEGYVGIRPKLVGPGQADADFLVLPSLDGNRRGAIHLFGIESPGITASLAIGRYVLAVQQGKSPEDALGKLEHKIHEGRPA